MDRISANQHGGKANVDHALLTQLAKIGKFKSLLDVGCGPGQNVDCATALGFAAFGADGDRSVLPNRPNFEHVDYRLRCSNFPAPIDIGWSVEFAEHIPEAYIENFMKDYAKCKMIIFTAAPPGWGGLGHVNEQPPEYWIEKFNMFGMKFQSKLTNKIRSASILIRDGVTRWDKKQFIRNRGLVFTNNRQLS